MLVRFQPGALRPAGQNTQNKNLKGEDTLEKKLPKHLPVDRLLPWIAERVEKETAEMFAARCGVSSRRFQEILSGRARFMGFNYLDKMLATEGSRTIMDFYPEYYDDDAFFAIPSNPMAAKRTCTMEGCDKPHQSKGLCDFHYRKTKRVNVAA